LIQLFDNLKNRVSRFTKQIAGRSLSEKDVQDVLDDLEMGLLESDVAVEVTDKIIEDTRKALTETSFGVTDSVPRKAKETVKTAIQDTLQTDQFPFLEEVERARSEGRPYVILFVGYNGTGKTTTIGKVAHLLMKKGYSCVIAASDTYRAAAIEQLQYHADRLGIKMVKHKRGSDSAAVVYDARQHARSKGIDVVLADTAGRVHTNINLMDEMRKIVRVNSPDAVFFVGDALAGNDIVQQVREFNETCDIDAIILTKIDADVKGGAAVSVSHTADRPILFVGTGQGYEDLQEFSADWFVDRIFEG